MLHIISSLISLIGFQFELILDCNTADHNNKKNRRRKRSGKGDGGQRCGKIEKLEANGTKIEVYREAVLEFDQ